MICPVCAKEIPDGLTVCPICGAPLTAQQNAMPQNAMPQNAMPQNAMPQNTAFQYAAPIAPVGAPAQMPTSVKKFIKSMSHIPEYKQIGSGITISAVILYVCAGITMLYGLISGSFGFILDVLVLVGLGLWIQLGYSRVAAIIALVYSVFSMILTTISMGRLSGYWIVIGTVCGVVFTFRAASAYKNFKNSATAAVPPQQFPQQ